MLDVTLCHTGIDEKLARHSRGAGLVEHSHRGRASYLAITSAIVSDVSTSKTTVRPHIPVRKICITMVAPARQ